MTVGVDRRFHGASRHGNWQSRKRVREAVPRRQLGTPAVSSTKSKAGPSVWARTPYVMSHHFRVRTGDVFMGCE